MSSKATYAAGTAVAVLVPRLSDGGERDRLWQFCRAWWLKNAPDFAIFEGHSPDGVFCRSREINLASRAADEHFGRPWDVALVIDGDIFLKSIDQARQAVQLAGDTGRMAFAHDWRFAIAKGMTNLLLQGVGVLPEFIHEKGIERNYPDTLEAEYGSYGPTFSSCQAYRRDLWEEMGGFDERFKRWGAEDWAAWTAPNALRAGIDRVQGAVYHMYHDRTGEDKHEFYAANIELGKWYMAERNNKQNMLAIIQGWKDLRKAQS